MRKALALLSIALFAGTAARAAETVNADPIPPDFLQQFTPFAIQLIQQQFPNAPVKVDPAAEKTVGYHVKEMVGLVALPDKNLTSKAIDEAGDKEIPVCWIATKSLSISNGEGVLDKEKVAVADFNGMFKLPVFFLAAKGSGADRTLLVYSKEGKPVVTAPLKKQAGDANVPLGLKLTDIDVEKKALTATLSLGGAYEATLKMGFAEF